MSRILRLSGLTRAFGCATVVVASAGTLLFVSRACHAATHENQAYELQDPGEQEPGMDPLGQMPGDDLTPRRNARTKTTKKKSLTSSKLPIRKTPPASKAKGSATKTAADSTGQLKFSQDIAPILVANCINCHSGEGVGLRRGKLDLSTFEMLKKGSQKRTDDQEIVVAGKPDDSHLVLRIRGDEEPRMPQGGQNRMSDDAVAKISQWVKEGANLDEGLDPKKPIKSYAASADQVVKNKTARMPAQERDKQTEAVGLERWKQANPKLKPEIERGEHFMIFGNLPADRMKATIKGMETQYTHLKRLLGSPLTDWVEKVSIYAFSSRKDFIEFVRTVEAREAEADIQTSARLSIPQPYLAVVDPAGGQKEEPAASKRKGRSKRGESKDAEVGSGPDRSLLGELTEALATGAVASTGTAPRWLAQGIGAYMSSQVEPRSSYYRHLRQTAFAEFSNGWRSRASEALGATDRITAESLQAVGFALVEAMMSGMRQGFPDFVQGMIQGGDKLDDMLKEVYGGTREEFLDGTADWVAAHYGRLE
jgi:mono/diheme cytochrome c family protein